MDFAKSAAVNLVVVVDGSLDTADAGAAAEEVFKVFKELLGKPLDSFSSESQSTKSESNSEDKEYPAEEEEEHEGGKMEEEEEEEEDEMGYRMVERSGGGGGSPGWRGS